jgi:flagellar motility protein MotE (MotC chaperone)
MLTSNAKVLARPLLNSKRKSRIEEDMSEEKEAAPAAEAKPKSSMMPVILVAVAVYLGATGGFSYMLGAFEPPPPPEVAEKTAGGGAGEEEAGNQLADQFAYADAEEDPDAYLHEAYRDDDRHSGIDSLKVVKWLEREKLDIRQQRDAIESQKRELVLLKRDIEKLLAKVQKVKSERIGMMAKLYDSMDPEAVAKQISNMADRTVVMLLPQMNTRTAAKVMALLDPKRAAQITTKLLAME